MLEASKTKLAKVQRVDDIIHTGIAQSCLALYA